MSETIVVDPEMEPALARMNARMAERAAMGAVPIEEMRNRARQDFAALNANPPDIALVEDSTVSGPFGVRKVRIYDACGQRENAPGLIYFHGGGWIVGDLDTEDTKLRRLALHSKVRIVSVDYVLAPEYKFPKPLQDCEAAAQYLHDKAQSFGLDANRLAIGGASAGANLALATALSLRDAGRSWLRHMLLFYGVFDMASTAPSRTLFAQGYGLGADAMALFYTLYLRPDDTPQNPMASPLRADLQGLPAAFINAAGLDVLRDDSRQLAQKMRAAGCRVEFCETPGVIHGHTLLAHEVSAAQNTLEKAGHALFTALA